jgi:hypothetical protein
LLIFQKDFINSNPNFGLVVVFMDCPLHRGHPTHTKCGGRMTDDQSGKVRIQVLDSDTVIQQRFSFAPKKTQKPDVHRAVGNVNPDLDVGSVFRCCTGFAPFYGTWEKADVRIQTFESRSASQLRVPYRFKTLKKS